MAGLTIKCSGGLFAAAVIAGLLCLGATPVRAEDGGDQTAQIEQLFREGVDLYQQGKYSEAQRRFRDVLALDPRKELAARLVDEAGTRIMAKMMADARMGSEPSYIWSLYRKYYVGKLADKDRMTKMAARLVDPNTTEDERALLYREFGELSHYAVPFLAPYLKDATHEDYRTYARVAIARMGSRAALPVITLLDSKDQLMRENAILTLEDLQPLDERAIPALKARLEDANESVTAKTYATRVLGKITGLAPDAWKPAAQLYYELANRYYLDRAGVEEEAEEVDGMLWHLNDAGDLIAVQYPLWAWNGEAAEDNTLRGIALNADDADFYPLWACIQAGQFSEVKDLLDIIGEQPAMNTYSAEEKAEIGEWDKKLVNARRLIAMTGKEYVNAALQKTLDDLAKYPGHARLPGVATVLAHELAALDPAGDLLTSPTPPPVMEETHGKHHKNKDVVEPVAEAAIRSASALVSGLDCSDQSVQYACALTLGAVNRFPQDWMGSEKVAAILGRGLGEDRPMQILLVDENQNAVNEMRQRLEALHYGVTIAVSGRDALQQARSFPPKDIAIVAENIRRDLSAEQVLEEFKADPRTRYMPAGILHAQADRDLIISRFGTSVGLVERENSGNDLDTQVKKIGDQRIAEALPKRKAHEISVACGTALAAVDSNATHLNLADAVPYAIKALVGRPDDVRNPAAIFLGNVAGGAAKDEAAAALKAVYLDTNNAVDLRANALHSLGLVQPDGLEDVYVKAQGEADQRLKDIGAEAFGQKSRANKAIADLISSQRIDKDSKEK